jgi:hypothetical protein
MALIRLILKSTDTHWSKLRTAKDWELTVSWEIRLLTGSAETQKIRENSKWKSNFKSNRFFVNVKWKSQNLKLRNSFLVNAACVLERFGPCVCHNCHYEKFIKEISKKGKNCYLNIYSSTMQTFLVK